MILHWLTQANTTAALEDLRHVDDHQTTGPDAVFIAAGSLNLRKALPKFPPHVARPEVPHTGSLPQHCQQFNHLARP